MDARKSHADVSARALQNIHDCEDMHRLHSILANLYHPVSNPGGVVNLGVAENVRNPPSPDLS